MLGNFSQQLNDIGESRLRTVRMTGTGATPTKNVGHGCAITRVGAGDYKVTFSEFTGFFVGGDYALESAIMTDLKNFSVVFKNYDSANRVVEFTLFNAAGTAVDLAANQQIVLYLLFAMQSPTLVQGA